MRSLNAIILREWKRIFSIPNFYLLLLVMPPLLFMFYGYIYQRQFATQLPIAVFDQDQSSLSHKLTDMVNYTEGVNISQSVSSMPQAESLIKQNKIFAVLHFPAHMEADIKSNKPVFITLYTNGAALVAAKLIYKDVAGIIIKGGLGVVMQKSLRSGIPQTAVNTLVQPIKLSTTVLYNPRLDYQRYLTPGLITVGLQMVLIVASVLILNLEFHNNTISSLLAITTSPSVIVAGKLLAHLSIAWLIFLFTLGVVFPVYGLSVPGSAFNFFIIYTLLAMACICIGLMLSGLFLKQLFVVDAALFITSPAFVFSGYTFPREAMPWFDKIYAAILPYTHFMDAFLKIYFMRLPMQYIWPQVAILSLFTLVCLPVGVLAFARQLHNFKSSGV